MYKVFNYTDNIYASSEEFKTQRQAKAFIKQFRERFKVQGYYRDNRRNKVAINEIEIEVIDSDFTPFRGNFR